MIRAVFFDAGHTLLYAHPDLGTVYAETTAALGVRLAPARYTELFLPVFKAASEKYSTTSLSSDAQDYAMWQDITRQLYDRIPELSGIEFGRWFEALYRRFGEAAVWKFYDDVVGVLRKLRAHGVRIGVVSNWDSRLRAISEGVGLTALVDHLVISAEAGVRKPDPKIFSIALKQAGVAPHETIHVGDLPEEDALGARRAGLRPVLIDRANRISPGRIPPGVPVLSTLEDLFGLL